MSKEIRMIPSFHQIQIRILKLVVVLLATVRTTGAVIHHVSAMLPATFGPMMPIQGRPAILMPRRRARGLPQMLSTAQTFSPIVLRAYPRRTGSHLNGALENHLIDPGDAAVAGQASTCTIQKAHHIRCDALGSVRAWNEIPLIAEIERSNVLLVRRMENLRNSKYEKLHQTSSPAATATAGELPSVQAPLNGIQERPRVH